jgi:glycosyltransferase involved in cell wall biosynthesis
MSESEVLKEIKKHFSFLFDRGYEIVSTRYYSGRYGGGLEILFESPDFSLKIDDDDGLRFTFGFGSPAEEYMSVGAMIYFLSREKEVFDASSGIKELADLMGKYIEEIESGFRNDDLKFREDVKSAQEKYDEALEKSFTWPVSSIIYGLFFIVCFYIYNELALGWLLSEWLLHFGYIMPSLLMNGVSLVLAATTTYAIHKNMTRPIHETEFVVVSTDQRFKKKSALVNVIRFLIFWVAYVLIMFVVSAFMPIGPSIETVILISEIIIAFLLAAWTVYTITNRELKRMI